MSIRDTFAQPRDPATAIHGGTEGAWLYLTIRLGDPVPEGWRAVYVATDYVLIKRTIEERVYP